MYLFKFTLFIALFHISLAVKTQQLQQQCECAGSASPVIGTCVPVYNPYDENSKLDTSKIPDMGAYFQNAGMNCVTILATRAAGAALTLAQQKTVCKSWCDVKKSTGFPYTLICEIPLSDNYNDTLEMARYFRKSCCDVIAAEPPIIYAYDNIEDLSKSMSGVAKECYPKPFLYVAPLYPLCEFDYNPLKLFKSLSKNCDNFFGMQTNLPDCLIVQAGIDDISNKVLVSDTSVDIVGVPSFCLNGSNTLLANLFPNLAVQINEAALSGNIAKGDSLQKKASSLYIQCIDKVNGPDRTDRSNELLLTQKIMALFKIISGTDVGYAPNPFPQLTRDQVLKLYKICEDLGIATTYPYDVDSYTGNNGKNQYAKTKKNKNKYNTEHYGSKHESYDDSD